MSLMMPVVIQLAEPAHWCDLENRGEGVVQCILTRGDALSNLVACD